MKRILLPVTGLMCLLMLLTSAHTQAQDTDKIKEIVRNQFEPEVNISATYSSKDFWPVPQLPDPIDELSLERIEELKDSLSITDNQFYLTRIGKLYGRLNQKAEASTYLYRSLSQHKKLLNSHPDSLETVLELFAIYMELGETDQAIEISHRALELDPADSLITGFVSFLHMSNGNFEAANEWADKSMEQFPQAPIGYLYKMLALLFEELGVMQQSQDIAALKSSYVGLSADFSFLQEARDRFKDDMEMQVGMLCCQLLATFYEKSIPMMFDPIDDVTDFRIELSSKDKSGLKKMRREFTDVLNAGQFENKATLCYSIGLIDLILARYESAIENLETSIAYKPLKYRDLQNHVSHQYDCLIGCYMILDDKAKAKEWSQRKIDDYASVDPQAIDYYNLALYYVVEGDLAGGTKILEDALRIDPESCEALVGLANINMLQDNLPKSEELLDQAYKINADHLGMASSLLLNRLFYNDLELVRFLVDNRLKYNPEDPFALEIQLEFLSD